MNLAGPCGFTAAGGGRAPAGGTPFLAAELPVGGLAGGFASGAFLGLVFFPASSFRPISDPDEELEDETDDDRSRLTDFMGGSIGSCLTFLGRGFRSAGGVILRLTGTRSTGFGLGSTFDGLGGGARLLKVESLC